jgi:prephenate dehydrogenase
MIEDGTTVTVIGLGLIGGALCHNFKKKGLKVKGVSSAGTIAKAAQMNIIDDGFEYARLPEILKETDFVFVCTPLLDIGERLGDIFKHVDKNTIVSDVGSTKSVICSIAEKYIRKGVYFIGGHPMAGSEKRGIENANPYLFYDAVYVLTPLSDTPKKAVKKMSSLIELLGANVMILPPDLHDEIAANVSHLPQLLAVLLTNHLADKNNDLFRNLAAGGFRDMTRIASSSYSIWRDILKTNMGEVKKALSDFKDELSYLIERLSDDNYLDRFFVNAQKERKTIPRYSKGFLKPLFDVRVAVQDRQGELARITNTIYYHDVNIKDIEIVNIREGEGGILRLGFSEKNDALKAASALQAIGCEVAVMD